MPAKSAVKNVSPAGEGSVNIYPIMLRVSASRDTYTLTVKIGKKVHTKYLYSCSLQEFSLFFLRKFVYLMILTILF